MPSTQSDAIVASPRVGRLPAGMSAFRHRNYRLFFSGQLISVTGTWMQSLAQSWLVLSLTSSALLFSLVSVLQFAPVLVLGMWAGVLADRYPKRSILLITQASSSLLAAILAVLTATDRVQLWHVFALAFGLGIVNAFDMPTRQAFVVEMVGKEDLPNAIAFNSSLFNAARIVGPALAGLMLALSGPALCFGINALSYVAVLIGLLMMRLGPRAIPRRTSGWSQMREGLDYVRATPALLLPVSLIFFIAIFGVNFNVWVPLLAKHDFAVGAGGFGLFMAALGAGSLLGALGLAFFARGPRPDLALDTAVLLGGSEIALAIAAEFGAPIPLAVLLLPLMGFGMATTSAMANTVVQTESPEAMRGRVMSVYMTVFAGLSPVGSFLAGALADWFGTPVSIGLCGIVTVVSAVAISFRFGVQTSARRATVRVRGIAP